MYQTHDVLDFFRAKLKLCGRECDEGYLRNLVFYAHGWCLVLYGFPLIKEQFFNSYGPHLVVEFKIGPRFSEVTTILLERIWTIYSGYSKDQLFYKVIVDIASIGVKNQEILTNEDFIILFKAKRLKNAKH